MKRYYYDFDTGRIKFYLLDYVGRERIPRKRAQKMYTRFGGKPFIPFRIAFYTTPAFYYSDLMRHRRKHDLDNGISKVKGGIYFARQLVKG